MRTLGNLIAVLTLLVTGAVSAAGQARTPSDSDLPITGQQTFAGEVTPTVATDADGDAVLVTLQRNADHPDGPARRPGPGRRRPVGPPRHRGPRSGGRAAGGRGVALGIPGGGVELVRGNRHGPGAPARRHLDTHLRHPGSRLRLGPAGRGQRPRRRRRHGRVLQRSEPRRRTTGRRLDQHPHPRLRDARVGIDARGIVYAATALSQRGGDGDVGSAGWWTRPVTGRPRVASRASALRSRTPRSQWRPTGRSPWPWAMPVTAGSPRSTPRPTSRPRSPSSGCTAGERPSRSSGVARVPERSP